MSKIVVFLLHGMGLYETAGKTKKGWHDSWVEALEKHFGEIGDCRLTEEPFSDRFEFLPITYDDVMRQQLTQWNEEGKKLAEARDELSSTPGLFEYVEAALLSAGSDDFFWTHAADVLLYRAVPSVRRTVRLKVAAAIVNALNERKSVNNRLPDWGVIAHSLGTAVAHDALHGLWTDGLVDDDMKRFLPTKLGARAQLVAMIANVSRILQDKNLKVFASTVMPGKRFEVVWEIRTGS